MLRPRTLLVPAFASTALVGLGLMLALAPQPPEPTIQRVTCVSKGLQGILTTQNFPRHFHGSFLWDAAVSQLSVQGLELRVRDVNRRGDLLVATGKGVTRMVHLREHEPVSFTFRIEVDLVTGKLEMWESDPSNPINYVTEGKYVAHIRHRRDLFRLPVRWHGDNGQDGALSLRAVRKKKRLR